MSQKGSKFERDICKQLSLWWTENERDDIFWRTAGSGARAKVRGRKGKDTSGQHGDIAATDPIGAPLIDLITIELKRGYSKHTIADLLDKPVNGGKQIYEQWIEQAIESHQQAKSLAWMIIAKRDRRETIVLFNSDFLMRSGMIPLGNFPRFLTTVKIGELGINVCGMPFNAWLSCTSQKDVLKLAKKRKKDARVNPD